ASCSAKGARSSPPGPAAAHSGGNKRASLGVGTPCRCSALFARNRLPEIQDAFAKEAFRRAARSPPPPRSRCLVRGERAAPDRRRDPQRESSIADAIPG